MSERMNSEAIFVRVRIDEGDNLLYATSPDMDGLYVAESDLKSLINEVPEVIKALLKAENDHDFEIWRTRVSDPDERAWVAIPASLVAGDVDQTAHV